MAEDQDTKGVLEKAYLKAVKKEYDSYPKATTEEEKAVDDAVRWTDPSQFIVNDKDGNVVNTADLKKRAKESS